MERLFATLSRFVWFIFALPTNFLNQYSFIQFTYTMFNNDLYTMYIYFTVCLPASQPASEPASLPGLARLVLLDVDISIHLLGSIRYKRFGVQKQNKHLFHRIVIAIAIAIAAHRITLSSHVSGVYWMASVSSLIFAFMQWIWLLRHKQTSLNRPLAFIIARK